MKNLMGCLLAVIGIPVAGVVLYLLAFIVYFLFNVFLYFLPVLVVIAIRYDDSVEAERLKNEYNSGGE